MNKTVKGSFTTLDGKSFYKIENYDCMEDFFMTITSSSDIWNFCWSKGGVTAGRINSEYAIFPYYTADKVADAKSYTGPFTSILVEKNCAKADAAAKSECPENAATVQQGISECEENCIWEPFANLSASAAARKILDKGIKRNIYKNTTGTCVWFEEINENLGLTFRYAWTSSAKFGIVRKAVVTNNNPESVKIKVLDGCQNILPACITSTLQNDNSVLIDAYKKTDYDEKTNLALFALSSVVSDKAEPSEGLFANVSWFSTDDEMILNPDAPKEFAENGEISKIKVLKGKRASAFICKEIELGSGKSESWYQVFDTYLDASKIAELNNTISDRKNAIAALEKDIDEGQKLMETYIGEADGFQNTADLMTCTHHTENVMFNIMRGGFFANLGKISLTDFVCFVGQRNTAQIAQAKETVGKLETEDGFVNYKDLEAAVLNEKNPQLSRLFYEYMPLTFSRRHGDPSRPWNRFNINLKDGNGNPILNYEGNWRDIFQNWEALAWSYPEYIKNMCSKFLNAMTAEGFNPYRISRAGIDWEVPEIGNPWSHIGYWGDHQVIYLEKLLEFYSKTERAELLSSLNDKLYASANVPYRIKSYDEIVENPRDTIVFDRKLSGELFDKSKEYGSDAKLVLDENGNVSLVSMTAKLLQIVIAKAANFIPGGGIWLNTQRPEWNDANNALAGYGLSMVTLCYLHRFIDFLLDMFEEAQISEYSLPSAIHECFTSLGGIYKTSDAEETAKNAELRKAFADKIGLAFQKERDDLYKNGYASGEKTISKDEIRAILQEINRHVETTITLNKREDGLFHSYNTMKISESEMQIETLQEMLEGQVAVLSSGFLTPVQSLDVIKSLKKSRIYEARQHSYMLYPNKELLHFLEKNCVAKADVQDLAGFLKKTSGKILKEDQNGVFHFNGNFCNIRLLNEALDQLPDDQKPTDGERTALNNLYEKTFHHQSFTGRSGTFYAYEGLGSIYWHMVSKLLLAVQETLINARNSSADKETIAALEEAYYDVRSGIGFNKEPELYGAFPFDPYSHTPSGQGAKQPGMTGQVKEEILTRWGELGISINHGIASFVPTFLKKSEFFDDKTLSFTWCGAKITYHLEDEKAVSVDGGAKKASASLTEAETKNLFRRDGSVKAIDVWVCY